jgi:DNA-binding MurR/RpiR family transcriptional regulator
VAHGGHRRSVGELIRESTGTLTPSERKVARLLLASSPIAGLDTVQELAGRAQVSAPTVIRCIAKLGFTSYADFQRSLKEELEERLASPLVQYRSRADELQAATPLDRARRAFSDGLSQTFDALPAQDFDAVRDLLSDSTRPLLAIGGRFSRLLASYLVAHLQQLRPSTLAVPPGAAERTGMLLDVGRRHTVVVFDYRRYQSDTVNFAREAARRGALVVLFTDPWLSPAADVARFVLPAAVEAPSPFDSLVPALAVVESVIAAVVSKLGERPPHRVGEFDRLTSLLGSDGPVQA